MSFDMNTSLVMSSPGVSELSEFSCKAAIKMIKGSLFSSVYFAMYQIVDSSVASMMSVYRNNSEVFAVDSNIAQATKRRKTLTTVDIVDDVIIAILIIHLQ